MAETTIDYKKEKNPWFMVQQAPGFRTGLQFFQPGDPIEWVVPDGWNDKRYGKHFAHHHPSITFLPLNEPAEDLMAQYKSHLAKRHAPVATEVEKLTELVKLMAAQNAENNKQTQEMVKMFGKILEKLTK